MDVLGPSGRLFPVRFPVGTSSERPRFRDEGIEGLGDLSVRPDRRLVAFAAPLVTRRVEISGMFESVLVAECPSDEAAIPMLSGHVEGSTTVIGLGSINRGSIFAMSKSREEAGVSVPCRLSDSVDASLEGPSLELRYGILGRWHSLILISYLCSFLAWARDSVILANCWWKLRVERRPFLAPEAVIFGVDFTGPYILCVKWVT